MSVKKEGEPIHARMLSRKEAVRYIGMGETRTREFCSRIGAIKHIGRRVLFDKKVIDNYLDNMEPEGKTDER